MWLIVHGIKGIDRRRRSLKGLDERSPEDENDHHNGLLMENVDNGYTYMGELHEDILSPYATLVEHSMSKGSAESQDHPFLLDCKVLSLSLSARYALVVISQSNRRDH